MFFLVDGLRDGSVKHAEALAVKALWRICNEQPELLPSENKS